MRIYIMRHGEAESFAKNDQSRALTLQGKAQSQQAAKYLAEHLTESEFTVWVSPYLRAQQTWKTMEASLPTPQQILTQQEITPYGNAESVAEYIKAYLNIEKPESLLLVSHLPLVGYLAAEFVPNLVPPMFQTSTIIALDYDLVMESATIAWQFSPSHRL